MKIQASLAALILSACGANTNSESNTAAAKQDGQLGIYQKNDRIRCYDDVSGEVSTIKITDANKPSAYVRFERGVESRFFPAKQVAVDFSEGFLNVTITDDNGHWEKFEVEEEVKRYSHAFATYLNGGDSRTVECELL